MRFEMRLIYLYVSGLSRAAALLVQVCALSTVLILVVTFEAFGQASPVASQASGRPQFDWFVYEGSDPVFEEVEADSDEYLNPILTGFHPDPSITRVGDDYYLVNSSFGYFPGVPLFHSTDLVHWEQIGHVLDRPSQLDLSGLEVTQGIFAPTIRYHAGTFYLLTTHFGGKGNFLVTTSGDPAGEWSDPVWLPFGGIDPSIFFDDDGTVYITNNAVPPGGPHYQGHRAIWMQEYDPEAQEMVGPRRVLVNGGADLSENPVWLEGPHLFKVDGTYYLTAAEGGTGTSHAQVIFRSEDVWGPYEPYAGNPILTQRHLAPDRPHPVTSTGHADFVELPNGDWWAVFLGVRPYRDDHFNTGRETFLLPVEWTDDGWPIILDGDQTVPYVHERPDLPAGPPPDVPTSGNFTVRTDFETGTLAPYWNVIRTPPSGPRHAVTNSHLTIRPRAVPLGSTEAHPAFVGRRQQHTHATVTTAMRYMPSTPGEKAGLAAFQNGNYYLLALTRAANGAVVLHLERKNGDDDPEVIASAPLDVASDETLRLKIEARGDEYRFYYARSEGEWTLLAEGIDGTVLSTRVAGGFVGTYFGLYGYSGQP